MLKSRIILFKTEKAFKKSWTKLSRGFIFADRQKKIYREKFPFICQKSHEIRKNWSTLKLLSPKFIFAKINLPKVYFSVAFLLLKNTNNLVIDKHSIFKANLPNFRTLLHYPTIFTQTEIERPVILPLSRFFFITASLLICWKLPLRPNSSKIQ